MIPVKFELTQQTAYFKSCLDYSLSIYTSSLSSLQKHAYVSHILKYSSLSFDILFLSTFQNCIAYSNNI